MSILLTRGLVAAVLATLPLQYVDSIKYPGVGNIFQQLSPVYISISIVVILATSIIAASGILLLKRRNNKIHT